MPEAFTRTFHVRWSDVDFNVHLKNTAYLDLASDVRMMFFNEHGLSMREMAELGVGPVVKQDILEYFREFRMLEAIRVDLQLAGLSEDGSRFRLRNQFYRDDGQLGARLTSTGGWLQHSTRKLVAAPPRILAAQSALARTDDFEIVPSSLRSN